MKKYIVFYRSSWPTVEEVFLDLKKEFKVTQFLDDTPCFLLITSKTQQEIQDWIEDHLPYSLRNLTPES